MTNENLNLTEEELASLLEAEIPATTPAAPANGSGAKSFKTRQFTLVSLPCLTIYLQGLPIEAPPSIEDFTFSWALANGVLKLRVLGYPSLPLPAKRLIQESFTKLIRADLLFTPEHATLVKRIVQEHPILISSAGGVKALSEKALNATAAADTISDWLTQLALQPTTQAPLVEATELTPEELETLTLELL